MSYSAVHRALIRAVYVARRQRGDGDVLQRTSGRWTALIEDDTWRRAHANMVQHRPLPKQASGR